MQHVRSLPRPQKLSAPARPELVFQWVSFAKYAQDIARLMLAQNAEVGHHRDASPFDPDFQQYLNLELAGVMRTLLVSKWARTVGFALCTVGPHMDHISTKWGSIMKLHLDPDERRGMRGQRMMRMIETMMRKEGVRIVVGAERPRQNARGRTTASLFDFNGYAPIETVFAKVLE